MDLAGVPLMNALASKSAHIKDKGNALTAPAPSKTDVRHKSHVRAKLV